jgi:hypothetical protein
MKHTDEEIEAAARQFEEWADNVDPATVQFERTDDLRAIAEAADCGKRNDARLVEHVALARIHGRSWNRIALALGVTRQAARQRFGRKIDA